MSLYYVHLEYSRCHHILYIWSTPDVIIFCTSGVLQMSLYNVHLEYSRFQQIMDIQSTPDIHSRSLSWSQPATQPAGLIHNQLAGYTSIQPATQLPSLLNKQPACYKTIQTATQPAGLLHNQQAGKPTTQPALFIYLLLFFIFFKCFRLHLLF